MSKTGLDKFLKVFVAAENQVQMPHSGDPKVQSGGSCEDLSMLTSGQEVLGGVAMGLAHAPYPWVLHSVPHLPHHNTKILVAPSSCCSWVRAGFW